MPADRPRRTFNGTLAAAIDDLVRNGYDSPGRVEGWLLQIRRAALDAMLPLAEAERQLREAMGEVYRRMVDRRELLRINPGVERFTLERVAPRLRAELDRRIMASADLIKLDRARAVERTLQRFSGWATSVPAGGTRAAEKGKLSADLRKPLAQLPFVQRRVLIDQGHKLVSGLNEVLATDGGAIAGRWRSRWRQAGYNYREDHRERDARVYTVRGNWAMDRGLMRAGPNGYTDQITKPGEEVFCRCSYSYLFNLRDLPADMLTAKGRAALKDVRVVA